jgi:pimeloyl-ACP methyl ester carboxylesterase
VHVVGHDWGSVQAWDAILSEPTDERLTGRIASFTSISGPCLDHVRAFGASAWRGGWGSRLHGLQQAARSWYVYAFQVPVVPGLVSHRLGQMVLDRHVVGPDFFAETLPRDAQNGVNLYRANFRRRPRLPGGPRTSLPVLLVVPLRDRYVTPALAGTAQAFVTDLTRVDIDAGHWAPRSHPDELARCLDAFVTGVEARRR